MRSSLINIGLLKSHIGRFMPLWIAFAAVWMVCLVLPLGTLAPNTDSLSAFIAGWSLEYLGTLVGCAIAGMASACCVFEYLFNRQAAIFAGSLPVKRSALFATAYIGGLLPLLLVEVVVFGIVALMSVALPQIGLQFAATWLGLACAFTFVFYSIAVFCAQLTGTKTAAYYLYLVVNVFVVFIEFSARIIASSALQGVQLLGSDFCFVWASPLFGLPYYVFNLAHGGFSSMMTLTVSWLALAAYCVFAVVLVALAAVLNKRRHLERAQNPVAVSALRPVGKVLGAFALAALATLICLFCMSFSAGFELVVGTGQLVAIGAVAVIAAFAGSFFAHACLVGGPGSLKGSLKTGLTVSVVCVAFVAACGADVMGVKSYVPDAQDVSSVEVSLDTDTTTLASQELIADVANAHKQILDSLQNVDDADYREQVQITYALKNGSKVARSYMVGQYDVSISKDHANRKAVNNIIAALEEALDSPEGVLSRYSVLTARNAQSSSIDIYYQTGGDKDEKTLHIKSVDMASYINDALFVDIKDNGFGKAYNEVASSAGYADIEVVDDDGDLTVLDPSFTSGNCKAQAAWIKANYGVDILK